MKRKNILVVVGGFPQISETFIIYHIVTLIQTGLSVSIIAKQRTSTQDIQLVRDFDLIDKTYFRPSIPLNRGARFIKMIKYLFVCFCISPIKTLRSLNFFLYGKDVINGNLIITLYPYLKIKKPDVVHCHFGTNAILTEKILSILKWNEPFFVSFHGYDTQSNMFDKNMYRKVFEYANGIFVNSNFLKDKVINLGCSAEKIRILPVGFYNCFQNRKNKGSKTLRILTVARLIELKGIEYSLLALRLVLDELQDTIIHYDIIGDGPLRVYLEKKTEELNLDGYVNFKGSMHNNKVQEFYESSDIFMLTGITLLNGRAETQGLVYQEAACSKLAIIASDAGGVPEFIIDGETGLITKEKDVIDIKEKIKLLILNKKLREKLGENAREYALKNFMQKDLTNKMIKVYEKF